MEGKPGAQQQRKEAPNWKDHAGRSRAGAGQGKAASGEPGEWRVMGDGVRFIGRALEYHPPG